MFDDLMSMWDFIVSKYILELLSFVLFLFFFCLIKCAFYLNILGCVVCVCVCVFIYIHIYSCYGCGARSTGHNQCSCQGLPDDKLQALRQPMFTYN